MRTLGFSRISKIPRSGARGGSADIFFTSGIMQPMSKEGLIPQPDRLPTDGLTKTEDEILEQLLSKFRGGRISTPVYTELARIIPQPIVELVLLRERNGILETLLIARPKDDIAWPGMYHTPGSVLRVSDFDREDQEPLNGAFERIITEELHATLADTPQFAGNFRRITARGPEFGVAYIAELKENAQSFPGHIWYPVDGLAENSQFIQHQLGHVQMASDIYRKQILLRK